MTRPWIILDYDDTIGGILIDGEVHMNAQAYVIAGEKFDDLMEDLGIDRMTSSKVRSAVDMSDAANMGFEDKHRFAKSLVKTYWCLCDDYQIPVSHITTAKVFQIGCSVFDYPYVLLPGAFETLVALKKRFFIAIVTKGDETEQRRKITESGANVFADAIHVVGKKNRREWILVLLDLGIGNRQGASNHWAVGNSPKSDVNHPVSLGLNGIWVNQAGWKFEMAPLAEPFPGRKVLTADNISQVATLLTQTNE